MKVLHAAETIKGGVATVINSLVEYQIQQPQVNSVLCLVPSDQFENLNQVNSLQSYQFQRNGRNLSGMFNLFWSLLKIIKTEKPDVLHLHSSFAGLLGRLAIIVSGRRSKTKVIYCPHAFSFLMQTSNIKQKLYVIAENFLAIFTNKIICVSKTEYDLALENNFSPNKLALIYNGIKIKEIHNIRELNYKDNYKILFVGRFDFQKGVDILEKSIELLINSKTNMTYEFNLIGEAVNSDEIIKFQTAHNVKINQLGWLKPHQLEEQYLNHDAIVVPSRWEGFAMVPLEAMSYGLPIIASNIGPFKEIIEHNMSGLLFSNESGEDLYKLLSNINKIDFNLLRNNSLKKIQDNFSDIQMNLKTLDQYK